MSRLPVPKSNVRGLEASESMTRPTERRMKLRYGVNQADECWDFALGPERERIWKRLREIDTRMVRLFVFDKQAPDPVTEWRRFASYIRAVLEIGAVPMLTFGKLQRPFNDPRAIRWFSNQCADVVWNCIEEWGGDVVRNWYWCVLNEPNNSWISGGFTLLDQLQRLGAWVLTTYVGEKLALAFRARVFGHVQRLSLSYHDSRGTADSIYRIQYDADSIQGVAIGGLIPFLAAGMTVVAMVVVTARIDWQLALVALTVVPAIYVITRVARRHLRSGWQMTKNLESAALSVVHEALTGLRVVKAFGQEDREQQRFVSSAARGIRTKTYTLFLEGLIGLLVGLATAIGTALVLLVGISHVQSGVLSLGDLILVIGYLAQLYTPVQTISTSTAKWQSALASAERAFLLLDEAPDVAERPHARSLARAKGAIAFRDVSFAYGDLRPLLQQVSLDVAPGTRVGLSGATGAGKTTVVSLMMRLYDPTGGGILLDGVDLREYKLADLRNQFAVVLQEPVLFSASVAENIAFARPGASDHDIIVAAKAANVHDFIMTLPEGYQTPVGERGMRLSGGERQRVSLARAFLKDAPILILDEPTSSVDIKTEAAIMQSMERLMQNRTSFLITHRLDPLKDCDMLLHIEGGLIHDVGFNPDFTAAAL